MSNSKVFTGSEINQVFKIAKKEGFALAAVNVTGSNTVNASFETAKETNSPLIIQFSHGGSQFIAGKSLDNSDHLGSISGAIAGAKLVHLLSEVYDVKVGVHTDHCSKKNLPWVDGLLDAGEEYFKSAGRPLFSSHMLDLSEQDIEENLDICAKYLERMSKIDTFLEIELGITGGEEDGVNNEGIENHKLYTQPADVAKAYEILSKISPNFSIAASFGNVHGVYRPGNVNLQPIILKNSQEYVQKQFETEEKPLNLVFHGGSGSSAAEVKEAVSYGVVKMNIDTDLQWAFWDGVKNYESQKHDYLQTQIGNPDGDDIPNKKTYDPRKWLREGEVSFVNRLSELSEILNNINTNRFL